MSDFTPGLSPNHYVGFTRRFDAGSLSRQPQRVLLIGKANESKENFAKLSSAPEAEKLFGKDSELEAMAKAAFKAFAGVDLYALAVEESLSEALALLPDMQFTQVATSFSDTEGLKAINDHLEALWGYERHTDGHGFAAVSLDPKEAIEAYGGEGADAKLNYRHITLLPIGDSVEGAPLWAAALAATVARHAWPPYKPMQTLRLLGIAAPTKAPSHEQRNRLLQNGLSTYVIDSGDVRLDRLVTTYRFSQGAVDDSYRNLEAKMILSYLRYDLLNYLRLAFPRHGLALTGLYEGDVVSPDSLRPELIARHKAWVRENLVQNTGEFEKNLNVKVSENGESLEIHMPVQLMGQLRSTVTTIAFKP